MAGTEEETDNAWWTKPTFIISAIAVVLLIGMGIILFTFLGNEEGPEAAPPVQPQTSSPTATASESVSGESVCGLEATGGATLTSAPDDVEWEFLGGIAAPRSVEHGPGLVDEQTGVRSCYSHTPEGALLAAANQIAASGDPQLLLATTRQLALEGPGKIETVQLIERRIDSGDTSIPPVEIEGFRLLSYEDAEATLELVASGDSGTELLYFTTSLNMEWHQGDWYVRYNDDGSSGPVEGQISDLDGYILWGSSVG
ncbi:hypothetical protein [uncultured Arthrobacter sp.]|uniref:hypothetical protein n=1 Tax=uncultured Arthrobacter sp. TaxID=114050 RepID=UPI0026240121|nr:hypothetical protein [uncultured Arthrobacter sp.]